MNTKSNRLAIYNFKNSLFHLGTTYIWFFAIVVIVPTLISLIVSSNMSGMTWSNFVSELLAVAIFYTIADCLFFNYNNFKLTIQNGISRRTAWLARVKGILLLSLPIVIVQGIDALVDHGSLLYAGLFGTPKGAEWGAALAFDFMNMLSLFATALAVGYGLALLSKRGKATVIIGVPIAGLILLVQLVKAMLKNQEAVANVLKAIIGYSDKTGMMNPLNISLFVLVWLVVMLLLSFFFSSKMKLRRD